MAALARYGVQLPQQSELTPLLEAIWNRNRLRPDDLSDPELVVASELQRGISRMGRPLWDAEQQACKTGFEVLVFLRQREFCDPIPLLQTRTAPRVGRWKFVETAGSQ
jgi:hypothetical protein